MKNSTKLAGLLTTAILLSASFYVYATKSSDRAHQAASHAINTYTSKSAKAMTLDYQDKAARAIKAQFAQNVGNACQKGGLKANNSCYIKPKEQTEKKITVTLHPPLTFNKSANAVITVYAHNFNCWKALKNITPIPATAMINKDKSIGSYLIKITRPTTSTVLEKPVVSLIVPYNTKSNGECTEPYQITYGYQ